MKKLQALKSKYRLSRFIFEDIVFSANILKNNGMSIDVINNQTGEVKSIQYLMIL